MSLCSKCKSQGLPVYPVRYAVAPDYVSAELPTWAKKTQLPELSKHSKYVLRRMREGYLYVFCEYEDKSGDLDVLVYKVDEQGGFWQQDISKELELNRFQQSIQSNQKSIPLSDTDTTCGNVEHSSTNIAFITIAKPDKCNTAWLAFSECKWSYDTFNQYYQDEDKRDKRMQKIKPKQWLSSPQSNDGITAVNENQIASVMEVKLTDTMNKHIAKGRPELNSLLYSISFPFLYGLIPLGGEIISKSLIVSGNPFQYDNKLSKKRTSVTPWGAVRDYSKEKPAQENYATLLNNKMQSKERNNTNSSPMMVAVMDSIGIATELSNWCSSAMSAMKKVMTERQRENACCSGIDLFEKIIKSNDYAKSAGNFKQHIRQTNQKYLADAKYFNQKIQPYNGGVLGTDTSRIIVWNDAQKAKGLRVLNIVKQSKYNYIITPYTPDIEYRVLRLKIDASNLVNFIQENYLIETIGEDRYARIFENIYKLQDNASLSEISRLSAELKMIDAEFKLKAEAYEKSWHEKNKSDESAEKRWQKYEKKLNRDYKPYRQQYAAFLREHGNYIEALIDDLILWVDCSKQKDQHPLSLAADDFARDSDHYLSFANDILMSLGIQVKSDKVQDLFNQLIEDQVLDSHNILWSAVFANRKLDKEKQKKCVNFLLSLDKTSPMSILNYGELLDNLETVLEFYQGESEENKIFINLAEGINGISNSLSNPQEEHKELDAVKELLSLFDSQRNSLIDGDSIDDQIIAAHLQPMKQASGAVITILLKYLQQKAGNLSSAFAEAFFVMTAPSTLSKEALKRKMEAYHHLINNLINKFSYNSERLAEKLGHVNQKINNLFASCLKNNLAGVALTGGILGVHVFKIYYILADSSLKTKLQQQNANLHLAMAGTAAISASFRLLALFGKNGRLTAKAISNFHFSGNFFGFVSGIIEVGINWNEDSADKKGLDKFFYYSTLFIGAVSTFDLFFQLGKSSLIQVVNRSFLFLASQLAKKLIILDALILFGGRAILTILAIALNPWITIGLFLFQLYYELNKPDEIEKWMNLCRFGQSQIYGESDHFERYKTLEDEVTALKAIFEKFEQQLQDYYAEQERERYEKEGQYTWSASSGQILINPPFPK